MAKLHPPTEGAILKAVQASRQSRNQAMWEPMSLRQYKDAKDRPVQGPMWVSRMKLDAGLNQVAQLVVEAIRNLGDNNIYNAYSGTDNSTVDAEWVGHRAGVSSRKEPEPRLSEQKKFEALTAEASDAPVILYVFGGNFKEDPTPRRCMNL